MSKKRSIDQKIRKSQNFSSLTLRQRDLWHGLIAVVDDQGRMPGIPNYVRSQVWPYDKVNEDEVSSDLDRLVEGGYILVYSVEGSCYIQIINWWKYQAMQWAGKSDFPPPDGWMDRERYHGKKNIIQTLNWDIPGGYTNKGSGEGSDKGSGEGSNKGSGEGSPSGSDDNSDKGIGLDSNEVNVKVKGKDKVKDDEEGKDLVGVVSTLFENEIGGLTGMIREQIIDWVDNYPLPWIEDSIRIASGNNKRRVDYINGILKKKKIEGHGGDDGRVEKPGDDIDMQEVREKEAQETRERISKLKEKEEK